MTFSASEPHVTRISVCLSPSFGIGKFGRRQGEKLSLKTYTPSVERPRAFPLPARNTFFLRLYALYFQVLCRPLTVSAFSDSSLPVERWIILFITYTI